MYFVIAGSDSATNTDNLVYENLIPSPVKPKSPCTPTYENVLTTISITYKSPTKRFSNSSLSAAATDSIYEDVTKSIERAHVPTEPAVLPTQGANQPDIKETTSSGNDQRPKSLSALEELRAAKENGHMRTNLSTSAVCNSKSEARTISTNNETLGKSSEATLNSSVSSDLVNTSNGSSASAAPLYHFIDNNNELSPTDLSLSEIVQQSSSDNLSGDQYSCPATPTQNSLSPNVSPAHVFGSDKTRNTSESSLIEGKISENSDRNPTSKLNSLESDDFMRFSPTESIDGVRERDKRKSSESADDNSIYQQVKYFRRSVHEINALLELEAQKTPAKLEDIFDSLDDAHIYENVVDGKVDGKLEIESSSGGDILQEEDVCEKVDVKSLTNIFEEFREKSPQNAAIKSETNCEKITDNFTEKICNLVEERSKRNNYDRDSLPPCVRLRNLKHAIKTRSLDEREFNKECGESGHSVALRRKSFDENLGGYNVNGPKTLNQPKELPATAAGDENMHVHLSRSIENKIGQLNEQKLNRERIEKYKEERRRELHERYVTDIYIIYLLYSYSVFYLLQVPFGIV